MLLSIDPGLRACGAALWTPAGDLVAAELVIGARVGLDSVAWNRMAGAVAVWAQAASAHSIAALTVEFPRVYPRGGKGDPNDLLQLAAIVGALALEFDRALITIVRPSEWKSNRPKKVVENRTRKALTPDEIACVVWPAPSLRHNVWDSLGIGLWSLKAQRAQ